VPTRDINNDELTTSNLSPRAFLLIFAVALVARCVWGIVSLYRSADPNALEFPDEQDYWALAQSLANGQGLVGEHGFRALRMPLFPSLLSLFVSSPNGIVMAKAAQWFVGAAAAPLLALLAQRVGGRTAGLTAGLLVAGDPFLVAFSSLLLTETLSITLLIALWLAGWKLTTPSASANIGRWILLGIAAAACVHARESTLFICLAWILFLLIRRRFNARAILGAAAAVAIIAGSLLPWAIRNQRLTGHLCFLTHRGGISLYDGVGPQATGASNLGQIKQMPAVRDLDEAAWNEYFTKAALESIAEDPLRIARLAVIKIARTWNPLPNVTTHRSLIELLVSGGWTLAVYTLAIVGAIHLRRRDRGAVVALLIPALVVLVLHSVFVGSVRYRIVAMPMLEVLAAVGICAILTARKAAPDPDPDEQRNPSRCESLQ
jgi:4-amino-4-deoxy-L-arabinose transferase-like glycosyltransferase